MLEISLKKVEKEKRKIRRKLSIKKKSIMKVTVVKEKQVKRVHFALSDTFAQDHSPNNATVDSGTFQT
jgi:hypothetical protein